jgi:hypothetical protein
VPKKRDATLSALALEGGMAGLLGTLVGSTLDPAIIVPAVMLALIVGSWRSAMISWAVLSLAVTWLWRYPANARFADAVGGQATFERSLFWVAVSVALVMLVALGLRRISRRDS